MSTETFVVDCPGCGQRRHVPVAYVGRRVNCRCGESFRLERSIDVVELVPDQDVVEVAPDEPASASTMFRELRERYSVQRTVIVVVSLFVIYHLFADGIPLTDSWYARRSINKWLSVHTPSGKWDEIEFWGPVEVTSESKKHAAVCRIRIRTASPFGGQSVLLYYFCKRPQDAKWQQVNNPPETMHDTKFWPFLIAAKQAGRPSPGVDLMRNLLGE
jgi:hypothetical protein